jgi:hypothetical protein
MMTTMTTTKKRPKRSEPALPADPDGRAKGSRDTLSRSVLSALCRDFDTHGSEVIAAIRADDPATYLKLCLQIMPKQDEAVDHPLGRISDDELDYLERLLSQRRAAEQSQG